MIVWRPRPRPGVHRIEFVVRLARGARMVVLQDTRGTGDDFSEFVDVLLVWAAYSSFLRRGAAGGLAYLVSPDDTAKYYDMPLSVIAP